MKKILLATAIISIFDFQFSITYAQTQDHNPVVLEVGGQQIMQSEFMHDFRLSAGSDFNKKNLSQAEKSKSLAEYAELYANFRAKLCDSKALGLDTASDLRLELAKYRHDLAAPYLIDSVMLMKILQEAYERNRYSLHVSHILIKVGPDAPPEDTLEAYNRALEYRQRILNGEDFTAVAIEEARRARPYDPVKPNEGELAYFSSFQMVYPFETAAYSLQPGEVSMPVRTRYGYHLIKLYDRVEMYGKTTLQHIWLRGNERQKTIGRMYENIMSGVPFENIALQSDDESTAHDGGYIRDAVLGQLPQEYVKVLSELQPGEVSHPFLTRYGWHIVKLVSKDTLPPFESMVPYYKQRMARDQRGDASRKSFAASAREKYGIVDFTVTPVKQQGKNKKKNQQPTEMMASLDEIVSLVNDSVFKAEWRFRDTTLVHDLRPLVEVPGKKYNAIDFARYIRKNQYRTLRCDMAYHVRNLYNDFLDSVSIAYADSQLEKEYPEFADLVDEYRRGLMIFDYNEKMIWTAAINDSVGFAAFYARESAKKSMQNPEDSIYFWRTRARVVVLTIADSAALDPAKAVKLMRKALDKNLSSSAMQEMLLDKVNRKKTSAAEPVTVVVDQVEQGRQSLLASDQWQRGVYTSSDGAKGYRVLVVQNIIEPCLKGQLEARGYYLSGWQNEYEQNLCKSLRAKYKVKIHYDALNQIRF
jgi:peptidyl-prolyl cis-trans isomerase SurA